MTDFSCLSLNFTFDFVESCEPPHFWPLRGRPKIMNALPRPSSHQKENGRFSSCSKLFSRSYANAPK